MVSNIDSFLAKKADYILHTPCDQEADPNNLAPTASTASQMAMGDAVATSLLALRGFTPNDFAQYHPGGALGKQLYLRVHDIFPQNEKPFVLENENIRNTIIEMTSKRLGVAVVVDENKQVKGIITDGDLRRMLQGQDEVEHLQAKDIMSKNPQTIDPDEMAIKALEVMRSKSITQLIVADEMKYLGVIHLHDLLREGLV
jgi:arabinose-5-phosphate isomerase